MNPIRQAAETAEDLAQRGYFDAAARVIGEAMDLHGPRPWLKGIAKKYRLINLIPDEVEASAEDNFAPINAGSCDGYESLSLCDWPAFDPPPAPGGVDHYIFQAPPPRRPPRRLYRIPDARISLDLGRPSRAEFHVFDGRCRYLAELSTGENPFLLKSGVWQTPRPVALIDDRHSAHNVCHLWFDKLPRLQELRALRPDLHDVLLFAQNAYLDEVCALLELAPVDLTRINGTKLTLQVPELLVTNTSAHPCHPANCCNDAFGWPVAALREALPLAARPARRLYIDRQGAATRRVANFGQIAPVLAKHGFEVLQLETLSFAEQYAAVAQAEAVCGVHGAGLANIIFCTPNTPVIEVLPPRYATNAFWYAAAHFGLSYRPWVAAEAPDGERPAGDAPDAPGDNRPRADIVIDPAAFDRHLSSVLAGRNTSAAV